MKHALILSGGGAKGAFQAGVITKLIQQGQRFDAVAGVSVGALNGIMVALGKFSQLESVWRGIKEEDVFKRRGLARKAAAYGLHKIGIHRAPMGYFDNSPLLNLVSEHALGQNVKIPFFFGTVRLSDGAYEDHLIHPYHTVTPAMVSRIVASTAIPVVFDPVRCGMNYLVDGGVRVQTPIGRILEQKPDKITIITCGRRGQAQYNKVRDIVDVATSSLGIMMDEIFNKDLREFERINGLVRQSPVDLRKPDGTLYRGYDVQIIEPKHDLGNALDFSTMKANMNFNRGLDFDD